MGAHLIDGEFQSDKYPTTPRGKVPLSVKDKTAQDLLWEYAQRRRKVDAEFSDDLETALRDAGYKPPSNESVLAMMVRDVLKTWDSGATSKAEFEQKMRETICHFARVYIPDLNDLAKLALVAKLAYQHKLRMAGFMIGGTKIQPFWDAIDDLPSNLTNEAHREMADEIASWKADRPR
jgi:hypothetical protein